MILRYEYIFYLKVDFNFNSFRFWFWFNFIKFHENGKGLARGDINSDGFVDLIATNSNGYIFGENDEGIMKGGPIFLWINQENENSKLRKNNITYKYSLGKKNWKVSVLIKNNKTRKKIIDEHKRMKNVKVHEMKKYLKRHNFLKAGSYAPSDIIKKEHAIIRDKWRIL